MTLDQLTEAFEACRPQLRAYVLRMTASVEDTDDLVQETYLKAHTKRDTFQGGSSIKTWIFAIASNLARDYLRARKRWPAKRSASSISIQSALTLSCAACNVVTPGSVLRVRE